jgi:hypothetical protein
MMVAGIAVGLDSSDDECIAVKRWSAGRKFVLSDDEAAKDSNSNLKVFKPLDSDGEPDAETSGGDLGSNRRVLIEETLFSDVGICKKKKQEKKWKILSDSDCSFDEETSNTQLILTKGEDEVEQSFQSHFSLMKDSDLYDAEDSEDKVATQHNEGHSPQTYFGLLKETDVYDAEGSEDEVAPKHISKPKVRSLSERKSKVSLLHVEEKPSSYTVNPFSWSTRQPLVRVKYLAVLQCMLV